jgi:hypothetical protein
MGPQVRRIKLSDKENKEIVINEIRTAINEKYYNPKIEKISSVYYITFTKNDPKVSHFDTDTHINHACYIIEQFLIGEGCTMSVKIDVGLYLPLRELLTSKTIEVSGSIVIDHIESEKNGFIHVVKLADSESYRFGGDENVKVKKDRYNFHTHPESAYIEHNVSNGWPSMADFRGYWNFRGDTIFHSVIAREGVYIISLSDGELKTFVDSTHDINKNDHNHLTPNEFANRINKLKVFKVDFIRWGSKPIVLDIKYMKDGLTCQST